MSVPNWSLQPLQPWQGRIARGAHWLRHKRFHQRAYHWPIEGTWVEGGCYYWKTCPLCNKRVIAGTRCGGPG